MYYGLSSNSVYEDEEYLWFSALNWNGFYRVDKKTKEAELLFRFPEEKTETASLYSSTKKVGDYFVFCPLSGKNIVLYHEKTKEMKTLALKEPSQNNLIPYNEKAKFIDSILGEKNKIYFIPQTYPAIVELDLETQSLTYLDFWITEFEQFLTKVDSLNLNYFGSGGRSGESLFLPCRSFSCVMEMNLPLQKVLCHGIEGSVNGFRSLEIVGEEMYLLPQQGGILTKWNSKTHKMEEIFITETEESPALWSQACANTEVLYLIPNMKNLPYQVDLSTGRVKRLDYFQKCFEKLKEINLTMTWVMLAPSLKGNQLHFICRLDQRFYQVNLDTEEFTSFLVESEKEIKEILAESHVYIPENKNISLDRFIDFISHSVFIEAKKEEETVGSKILKETTK